MAAHESGDPAEEERFLRFYALPPNPTEVDLESSLVDWRRLGMSETFVESLVARLEVVRLQRPVASHIVSTEARYVEADDAWEYRRRCSCGNRGAWLRDQKKIAPCPRAGGAR
jgi:hypothetical protein